MTKMKMKREKTKNKPNRNGKLENTIPTFKYTEKSSKKKDVTKLVNIKICVESIKNFSTWKPIKMWNSEDSFRNSGHLTNGPLSTVSGKQDSENGYIAYMKN